MENYPKIYTGVVTEKGNVDPNHSGELSIRLDNTHETTKPITAQCAMPFGSKGSGFLGPVAPLSRVLVVKAVTNELSDTVETEWFWVGVIPTISNVRKEHSEVDITDNEDTGTSINSTNPSAKSAYAHSDVNEKVIIKSSAGHGVQLSEKVLTLQDDISHQEDFSLLTTAGGKQIKLDAGTGPGMDRILITDEWNNFIVIKTGQDGDAVGAHSMILEVNGSRALNSKGGQIAITVEKDSTSNIQIINDGTGDINVEARQGDVYVGAAVGDIKLSAKGTVQIDAEQDINLDANNNININAGTQMTLTAPRIDLNP